MALHGTLSDELALLILGHGHDGLAPDGKKVSFPATAGDPPSRILLAGTLCNLGGKSVVVKHGATATVDVSSASCCQFFMYPDEFDPETWKLLSQAPVRFASDAFRQGGVQRPFSGPWARAFTAKGRPTMPAMADTIAFHARVETQDLEQVLQASGHNHIYAVPKQWDRQPVQGFAILWVPSRGCQGHFAVFIATAFPAAKAGMECGWTKVSSSVPSSYFTLTKTARRGFRFQASSKASQADVQEWTQKCNWPCRVMKTLSNAHWLLGAASDPPTQCIAFKDQTILLQPVRSRDPPRPILQSGTVSKPLVSTAVLSAAEGGPWTYNDPWKA